MSTQTTDSDLSVVQAIGEMHFEGNVIPSEWFQHLKLETGKPDTNAILLLSDIVYWYRPTLVRDENSGQLIKRRKKFKADLLQKSYSDYETFFGFSKKQCREAMIRLENFGLIKRVFRSVDTARG